MTKRPRTRSRLSIAVVAAFVFALAAPTVLAADKSVAIRDFAFGPRTLTIRVGDTVTWTNRDSIAHSATARRGTFDTGLIPGGRSRSVRFTVAGTYRYICTPHPSMTGTVVVHAASSGVQPPNTDTALAADIGASQGSPWAVFAVVGGIAYLTVSWAFRRRREDADRLPA